MSHNHELENQDLLPEEALSEQDLDAVSGGNDPGWNFYVDDNTIGGNNWIEQHGPATPADYGLGIKNDSSIDPSGPLVTDPSPPP